jgi:hypothetical protein
MHGSAMGVMVASVLACATAGTIIDRGPDLVPERRPGGTGSEGFCDRNEQGQLIVRVRNQGNEPATIETIAQVHYHPGGVEVSTMHALTDGAFGSTPVPIPPTCFNPDCEFTITVDATQVVEEIRHHPNDTGQEDNNTASGHCIG